MEGATWLIEEGVDPMSLGEARAQTQNAVHWLARLANSYAAPEPDYRHVWLNFDAARRAFVTRPLVDGVAVELRLPSLEMQFLERGRPVPHMLHVEGYSPAKIEAWVLVELLHRGIDRDRFSKTLPYAVSGLMTGDNVEYTPDAIARELEGLTRWLGNAEAVLGRLGRELAPSGVATGLLCWPDQFHVGILVDAEPAGATSGRALRVGLSAGDERYAEPYFFVALQRGGEIEVPHPGGVLTASRIIAEQLGEDAVLDRLSSAVATTRRRLSN